MNDKFKHSQPETRNMKLKALHKADKPKHSPTKNLKLKTKKNSRYTVKSIMNSRNTVKKR